MTYPDLDHLFVKGSGKATPESYGQAGHVDERMVDTVAAVRATPR